MTGTDGPPPLAPGERVLARLLDTTASPVVVTTAALYRDAGDHSWRRLGWAEVARVGWDRRRGVLRLDALNGDAACQVTLDPVACPPLVALARERFGATLLTSALLSLPCGRTVALTARRAPGERDVTWVAHLDDGADDPDLRRQLVDAIHHLRADLGI
jgi:hypothetical protein